MKYEAVIFDLFGTLIENYPESEFQCMLLEVASIVSADPDRFIKLWKEYSDDLMTGHQEVDKCISLVCEKMGLAPVDIRLNDAYDVMTNRVRLKLEPPCDTLAILSYLNNRNHCTGLISNCSNEVPILWKDSLLAPTIEKPVFSCSVGLKKPDPRIYLLATEWLGVKPDECLFVDDNPEPLEGAARVGMTAVLIQDARLNKVTIDSDGWGGHIISSIGELTKLLDTLG
ncbi:HAD family hydrolase [Chloroflexota bacterium]